MSIHGNSPSSGIFYDVFPSFRFTHLKSWPAAPHFWWSHCPVGGRVTFQEPLVRNSKKKTHVRSRSALNLEPTTHWSCCSLVLQLVHVGPLSSSRAVSWSLRPSHTFGDATRRQRQQTCWLRQLCQSCVLDSFSVTKPNGNINNIYIYYTYIWDIAWCCQPMNVWKSSTTLGI